MAGSVNKVILVGNLGREPEVRQTQDGNKIVTFSIATSESWNNRTTGVREERTEWHRVVIFNPNLAEIAEKYAKKGSKVFIEGQLQTRKWTDSNTGQERYTTEVVISRFKGEFTLLDNRGAGGEFEGAPAIGGEAPSTAPMSSAGASMPKAAAGGSTNADFDDDIPF